MKRHLLEFDNLDGIHFYPNEEFKDEEELNEHLDECFHNFSLVIPLNDNQLKELKRVLK